MVVRQRVRCSRRLSYCARINRPIILLLVPLLLVPSFLLSTSQSSLPSQAPPGDAQVVIADPFSVARSLSVVSPASAVVSSNGGSASTTSQTKVDYLNNLPLSFEPNAGQANPSVRFLTHTSRATFYFLQSEVVIDILQPASNGNTFQTYASGYGPRLARVVPMIPRVSNSDLPLSQTQVPAAPRKAIPQPIVQMQFLDTNSSSHVVGGRALPGKVNYLLGSQPSKWKTDLPTYSDIVYSDLYNGVGLRYSGIDERDGSIKGTYILSPRADPTVIRWRYSPNGYPSFSNDYTHTAQSGTQLAEEQPQAQVQVSLDEKGNLLVHEESHPGQQNRIGQLGQAAETYNRISIAWPLVAPLHLISPFEWHATGSIAMNSRSMLISNISEAATAFTTTRTAKNSEDSPFASIPADQVIWTEQAPMAWQEIDGKQVAVSVRYVISGDGIVSFGMGSYDHNRPLFIDPTLTVSTYLGGGGDDSGGGAAVDIAGNVYLTGETGSANFPKANPYQPAIGGGDDAFISKLNANGTALIYSTYLGGSSQDWGTGIAVDASGNVYVTGVTASADFPTANPFQPALRGNQDAFVAKLDSFGSTLIYSTYLGGSGYSAAAGIAVDGAGDAYVTGYTSSPTDFPTAHAFQQTSGGINDAFVSKLAPSGSTLIFSTYLGGNEDDYGNAIAVDSLGTAYVTGDTDSNNFPLANGFQSRFAGGDAFVTKLAQAGSDPVHLVYSTYLGGSNADYGNGIAVDSVGCAYVIGSTGSLDFPIAHPIVVDQVDNSSQDAFVTKLNPSGTGLVYSTFLGVGGFGGSNDDRGAHIAVDPQGSAYMVGQTNSSPFIIVNAVQPYYGGGPADAFVTKINPAGSNWTYSTYLGGSNLDNAGCGSGCGGGIAADAQGSAYVAGVTLSTNFPVANAYQPNNVGGLDAFISKISDDACVSNFGDVHSGDWFYQYVNYIYCRGVISGYVTSPPCDVISGSPCFKPDNATTRGQVSKMVVLGFGVLGMSINTTGGPHFEDVPGPRYPGDRSALLYEYVETLYNMGVVTGYACGGPGEPCDPQHRPYFRPNKQITRGQIAKIVVSAAVQMDPAGWQLQNPPTNTFQDIPVGSTYFPYVETAYSHGVINGYPCGSPPAGVCIPPENKLYFRPGNNATRAQFSKVTYLVLHYTPTYGRAMLPNKPHK